MGCPAPLSTGRSPSSAPAHLLLAILSRALVLLVAATPATAARRLDFVRHQPDAQLPRVVGVPGQRRRAAVCKGILPGVAGGAVECAGARLRVGGVGRAPRECGDGRAGEGGAGGRGERVEGGGGGRRNGGGERRLECTVVVVDEGRPKASAGRDARFSRRVDREGEGRHERDNDRTTTGAVEVLVNSKVRLRHAGGINQPKKMTRTNAGER